MKPFERLLSSVVRIATLWSVDGLLSALEVFYNSHSAKVKATMTMEQ